MNAIKKWIPNIITLGNLTCGMIACYVSATQSTEYTDEHMEASASKMWWFVYPSLLIFGAAIFDFFDGMVARLLKVNSELGKQLDSLADVVSFGVAPSFIIVAYNLIGEYSLFGFVIGIFACIRLAKFNIDTRQNESFLGLPVPSVGIIIAALPFIDKEGALGFMLNPWFVMGLVIGLCALMVSELPLLALKFKTYTLSDNFYRYLVVFIGIIVLVCFQFQGLPLVILAYVLVSIISNLSDKKNPVS